MTKINTITGPIDPSEMGFTLMHEHIITINWSLREAFPHWVDREQVVKDAVKKVKAAKDVGVDTMVDLTAINLGRDIHIMQEVADKAEMNVIATTGFYYQEEPSLAHWEADAIVAEILPDVEKGIAGTSCKAGLVKCATDKAGVTGYTEKMVRVASRLHKATGVPISTHTGFAEQQGTLQQDIMEDEGVDLSRVVIGHCGFHQDLDYLERIMKRGSYIGMDQFAYGPDVSSPDDMRVDTIAALCKRGWAKRMVLSHDAGCYSKTFGHERPDFATNWHFCYVSEGIVPALLKAGVSQEEVDKMTIHNPRAVFTGEAN